MALFPAYEDELKYPEQKCESTAENIESTTTWLQNPSFTRKVISPPSVYAESEVITVSDSPVSEGSGSSTSSASTVRRKKRKREEYQKRQRKQSRQRDNERFTAKIDNIFLDVQNAIPSAAKLFDFDTKRDLENLTFDTTYKRQKAKFRKKKYSILLGSCKSLSSIDAQDRDSRHKIMKWRYFRFRKMNIVPKFVTSSSFAKFENSEDLFLPIYPSHMNIDGKDLIYDEKIRMYRPMNDEELINDMNSNRKNDHNALSRLLAERPNDIDLWLQFLKKQGLEDNTTKSSKTALLERKLSIIEKAIQLNPQSVRLKIIQIDLGIQIGWNFDTINEFFRKLEFQHVNDIEIWRRRLTVDYFPFSQFSVTKVVNLYCNCLQKLHSIMSGSLITHPCLPGTKRFFVSVLAGLVNFYLQSGHTEKSLALCQALLEFNFNAPSEATNCGLEEKRCLFEPFWDSGAPRIGEENSKGWFSIVSTKNVPLDSPYDHKGAQSHLDTIESTIFGDQTLNESSCWLEVENLRSSHNFGPLNQRPDDTAYQPDDPDRIVLFDDIEKFLYPINDEQDRLFLIIALLRIFDVALPRLESSSEREFYEIFSFSSESLRIFKSLPNVRWAKLNNSRLFFDNVMSQVSEKFEDRIYKNFLSYCRIYAFCFSLTEESIPTKEKLKIFRGFVKGMLNLPEKRENTLLYVAYAQGLFQLGNSEEALNVLSLAISKMDLEPKLYKNTEVLFALNTYIDVYLSVKQDVQRLKSLLANIIGNGRFSFDSISNILRMKSKLENLYTDSIQSQQKPSSFLEQWLNSPFILFSCLYIFVRYLYSIDSNISEVNLLFDSCETLVRSSNFYSNKDIEFLNEKNLKLNLYHLDTVRQAQPRICIDRLSKISHKFPSNLYFLKSYCDRNLSGYLSTKVRRFLTSLKNEGIPDCINLSIIYFEFMYFLKMRDLEAETASVSSAYDFSRLRKILDLTTDSSKNNVYLWRLFLKFEQLFDEQQNRRRDFKDIFYRAIKNCPFSKDLYIDAVASLKDDDVRQFIDLMIEKEIRVRLPNEEFELLWKNSRHQALYPKDESDDDSVIEDNT